MAEFELCLEGASTKEKKIQVPQIVLVMTSSNLRIKVPTLIQQT